MRSHPSAFDLQGPVQVTQAEVETEARRGQPHRQVLLDKERRGLLPARFVTLCELLQGWDKKLNLLAHGDSFTVCLQTLVHPDSPPPY